METRTLQVILEHCFTSARLKQMFPNSPMGMNLYQSAVNEILDESNIGLELLGILDDESLPQRQKIQSMKVSELRSNLAVEFLEPGRTLGLILWSLMRDDRLSSRNLADQLAKRFSSPVDENDDKTGDETDDSVQESVFIQHSVEENETPSLTLDQQIAEIDETGLLESGSEDDVDDLDLDSLLQDIQDEEDISDQDMGDDIEDILDDPSEIDTPGAADYSKDVEVNDDLLGEVDSFIASLDEDEPDDETEINLGDIEDDLDAEALLEDVDFGESDIPEEDAEPDDEIEIEFELDQYLDDDNEEDFPHIEAGIPEEKIDELLNDDFSIPEDLESQSPDDFVEEDMEEDDFIIDDEIEEPEVVETLQAVAEEPVSPPVPTIQLGGISISLHSLKRACENVFNEPVELVTDENLTVQDQVVVVGRQCGVRIMHGPTWTQPIEPFRESSGESITINPQSLTFALSRVYKESVELIPDNDLLGKGSILFAGKSTGLTIMENHRVVVPLPEWAEGLVKTDDDSSEQMAQEISLLRNQIDVLASRIETLEQAPPPMPATVVETSPQPVDEPVYEEPDIEEPIIDEPVDELDIDEGDVSQEPISIDEIESEELEPVVEPDFDLDELDEIDIASITEDEDEDEIEIEDTPQEETDEEDDLDFGDVSLDELNLDDIAGDVTETTEESIEDDIGDISDIGEIDLSEIAEDEIEDETEEISDIDEIDVDSLLETEDADESELSDEEINLDDLDLSADYEIDDDSDEAAEIGDDELNLDDIGLDASELDEVDLGGILDELDSEDDSAGEVEPVFNGESILLLGGEANNQEEYMRVVSELGGTCVWHANLNDMPEGEIAGLVEGADIVMTLSSEAVSDPGIMQAANYAEEQGKTLIQHHSSSPVSIQKELIKSVEG